MGQCELGTQRNSSLGLSNNSANALSLQLYYLLFFPVLPHFPAAVLSYSCTQSQAPVELSVIHVKILTQN